MRAQLYAIANVWTSKATYPSKASALKLPGPDGEWLVVHRCLHSCRDFRIYSPTSAAPFKSVSGVANALFSGEMLRQAQVKFNFVARSRFAPRALETVDEDEVEVEAEVMEVDEAEQGVESALAVVESNELTDGQLDRIMRVLDKRQRTADAQEVDKAEQGVESALDVVESNELTGGQLDRILRVVKRQRTADAKKELRSQIARDEAAVDHKRRRLASLDIEDEHWGLA